MALPIPIRNCGFQSNCVSMHERSAYITDEFGSLSGLPDVGTVGHGGVVQAGFSVLLVGNL